MWWPMIERLHSHLHLYLTGSKGYVRRHAGWGWRRRTELLGQFDWHAGAPLDLAPWLGRHWRTSLHVHLGSALCRLMALEIPAGAKDAAEAQAIASASLQHEFGLGAAQWLCTVERAPAGQKSAVCAMRRELLERLRAAAPGPQLRLVSVKPLLAGVWSALPRRGGADASPSALLAVEEDAFTVVVTQAGKLLAMHALPHRGEADLVERELRRLGHSYGMAMETRVGLALARGQQGLLGEHHRLLLSGREHLRRRHYADFRDVLFAGEEGA
ncbi:hypothetical protein ACFOLJ_06355 [Rugamonas sp. CCM 8940]|uniref:hypothetical protein n=1 Tax=Rugamonas sp. CCM 8940 TaxID=2765359 RepID=UPI0018F6AD70|nr:hypothetical protein [Rugamonas sp. CCM 8940]MBJ7308991.1 hypothetical protein [Rugamonas sp. CCM 8940]